MKITKNLILIMAVALFTAMCKKDKSEPVTLTVSPTTLDFAAGGESKSVAISATAAWTAASSDSWLAIGAANFEAMEQWGKRYPKNI